MTNKKRLLTSWITLGISILAESIRLLINPETSLFGFLNGFSLVFLLVAIGYSVKIIGHVGVSKKHRISTIVILILASLLGIYAFII